MSTESQFVRDCHKPSKAEETGYQSIQDRYNHDLRFADRMNAMGFRLNDGHTMDLLSRAHLANPPRHIAQIRLGVGYNVEADHQLVRRVYSEWRSPAQVPEPFNHYESNWFFLYQFKTMSTEEYVRYLQKPGSSRSLLTWKGVIAIDVDNVYYQIEDIIRENLPIVLADVDRKLTQSIEQGARSREWEKRKQEQGEEQGSYYETVGKKTRQYGNPSSGQTEAQGGASSSSGWQPRRPQ